MAGPVEERPSGTTADAEASYRRWREGLRANPEYRAVYEEEAAKGGLWLQLAEARQAAGLTQEDVAHRLGVSRAQVARIEKRGYDAYTLATLRRYLHALGGTYALEITLRRTEDRPRAVVPA